MDSGIVSETKFGKTRQTEIETSVFATCNESSKLSRALVSRFFVVEIDPYTYEEFFEITGRLLDHAEQRIIANSVWNTSRNLRDS